MAETRITYRYDFLIECEFNKFLPENKKYHAFNSNNFLRNFFLHELKLRNFQKYITQPKLEMR